MGWPQVTMIALMAVGFTIYLITASRLSRPMFGIPQSEPQSAFGYSALAASSANPMFQSEIWFAWFPVATQQGGISWLTRVLRERSVTKAHATPWRYYHLTTTGA